VFGDRGYDAEAMRQGLRARRIMPWLAKRNTEHGSGLGQRRWAVERTFAWLNQFAACACVTKGGQTFTRHVYLWDAL